MGSDTALARETSGVSAVVRCRATFGKLYKRIAQPRHFTLRRVCVDNNNGVEVLHRHVKAHVPGIRAHLPDLKAAFDMTTSREMSPHLFYDESPPTEANSASARLGRCSFQDDIISLRQS